MKTLRLILGDQLNHQHPWLSHVREDVTYILVESRSETDYVRHHIQKVCAFFLAMRQFAEELRAAGHQVIYIRLDDDGNLGDFPSTLQPILTAGQYNRFEYQLPDEYRLDEVLKFFAEELDIPTEAVDTHHFFTGRGALEEFFRGKKTFILENFYRDLRRKTGYLMEASGEPATGRWNYDEENRNKYKGKEAIPEPPIRTHDATEVVELLGKEGVKTIGRIEGNELKWPVSRGEGLELLAFFCHELLPQFGKYQDAMTREHAFLFHSRLSFLMNVKLLSPAEVVEAVEKQWQSDPERYGIAQVEGFIRQILGWREYMRGVYWAKMPDYATLNYFGHDAKLPDWFWTGETKMECLRHSIDQSLEHAYAHHIQRLMVTGNFALMLGVDPSEVDAWYLGIYIDALEWVEITNTRGMSQFADGGIVGTKPYVASANYMHKMSDYCKNCVYDRKEKLGASACPLNSLYWDFYARHEDKLGRNPRIGMMYRTWKRFGEEQQTEIRKKAAWIKENIESL